MTETIEHIKDMVERAPQEPGCYLWKDEAELILYVGKAIKLRSRLRNYLNPADSKTAFLMSKATHLEWIAVDNESEALILESNLIKKYKPRYNVRLKDDKRYPFLCVSLAESYPRIFITRTVKNDGNRYFGPYTDVRSARAVLEFIHKTFPIRKVRQSLPLKKPRRPCMNFYIRRCLAPCQGTVQTDEYDRIVNDIILFLEGRREILEETIKRRMKEYSDKLEFEKAAIYRDLLINVRRTTEQQSVMSPGGGDEDLIALAKDDSNGQIVLMEVRGGRLLDRKSFPLENVDQSEDSEVIESFLREYYLNAKFIPARISIPVSIKDGGTLERYLNQIKGRKIRISIPRGGETKSILQMASRNAELLLKERILAIKIKDERNALTDLQKKIGLNAPPSIIECYDISHFAGTDTVASGVRFVNGRPARAGYRRYKIKSVAGIDDPASMREVIARRLQRLSNDRAKVPDLIVIDGGPTQLNAACEAASALGLSDLNIISLAKKREEVYFPGDPYPRQFDPDSPGMRLIRHARDEAHRFGITYQRNLRKSSLLRNALDNVAGVGPERKKAIRKKMAGIDASEWTTEDLTSIKGISLKLAQEILSVIQK